jgi:hypothetical protein
LENAYNRFDLYMWLANKYSLQVFPDMDFERVYDSDRRKMVKWFTQLKNAKIELKLSEGAE